MDRFPLHHDRLPGLPSRRPVDGAERPCPYCEPMIRHTVSFTLVHAADSPEEQEFLTRAPELLRAIDGVRDFTVSRQVSPKSSFRFQFAMSFEDQAAFEGYDAHPDHQNFVATRWATEIAEFQELDFVAYA